MFDFRIAYSGFAGLIFFYLHKLKSGLLEN